MNKGEVDVAYVLYEATMADQVTTDTIRGWRESADPESALVVAGLDEAQLTSWQDAKGLEGMEVYRAATGAISVRWLSTQDQQDAQRRHQEHDQLLLILQEALIHVAEGDSDLASKLAARAYVNLKMDPKDQRRYDGLLHRFTGVLHGKPKGTEKKEPGHAGAP